MEMSGEQLVPASQADVWAALNDPEILKACVPGCEAIDRLSDTEYQVLMVARVGPVSAKFKGKLALSDLRPPHSYALAFEGQGGAAGFGKGSAKVRLDAGHQHTKLSYDVKASVGGKLAQIGSRLIDAAAKKIADDFFRAFNEKVAALYGVHAAHEEHLPEPLPRDPDLPTVADSSLIFLAAGLLVVFAVALISLFG